jgi:branched-chain amino acid transport system substrate-binding protein
MRSSVTRLGLAAVIAVVIAVAGCTTGTGGQSPGLSSGETDTASTPIRVGVVLPLSGSTAGLVGQERLGIEIAATFANSDGAVSGRRIELDVRDIPERADAQATVDSLHDAGAVAIVGAYESSLSMDVSTATDRSGLVYWESGAVADQLTGRSLPRVFRVGADGARLGANSASFAAGELAPRLGRATTELRVTIVAAHDAYADSVADAAEQTLRARGVTLAARIPYELTHPDWPTVMDALVASRADVVILASHIEDGKAFRRAMLAAGVRVGALIGSTMAQCIPDFGNDLGADAIGVFASDRPPSFFNPAALLPQAREVYDRFAATWRERTGSQPTEEGISGFTSAWALFHDVLPAASRLGSVDPGTIARAARTIDLPDGALPNGAGLRFSSDPARLGQNERSSAVIWQWQGVRRSVTVWPAVLASGSIGFVPLPR